MTFVGSDGHAPEARHVEHQASFAGRVSGIAVASATDGERQVIGGCEAQGGLYVLCVGWTHYDCGMRRKLGCITLAQLFVRWVSRAEDCSSQSPRESCEVSIARLRDRNGRNLLRKAGPCEKWERRTSALPEERTTIHRCRLERMDQALVDQRNVQDASERKMKASSGSRSRSRRINYSTPKSTSSPMRLS